MSEGLINKYRPATFDDVVGHVAQVKSLKNAVEKGTAQSFLFTGPSGLGKTTLARIAAHAVGCGDNDIQEIDAATNTGIEAMREVTSKLDYLPIGGGSKKAVIVDEAHRLSSAAQESLLKILEEPPAHVFWFLCTTEPTKIRPTFKTRCHHSDLKPVSTKDIFALLTEVAAEEKMKPAKGVLDLCVEEAFGSPRQALSNLSQCAVAANADEAADLLSTASRSPEAFELARKLFQGGRWVDVKDILKGFKEAGVDPESVRRVVQAYGTTVALGAKNEDSAGHALEVLDAFSTPCYDMSALVLACGKVLLS